MLASTAARLVAGSCRAGVRGVRVISTCSPCSQEQSSVTIPAQTHTVLNQSVPAAGRNAYTLDTALVESVAKFGGAKLGHDHLTQFGERVGSAEVEQWCEQAHNSPPKLKTHDKFGNVVSQVDFHPSYHQLLGLGLESLVPSFAWRQGAQEGAHVVRAALGYLQYQADPGVSCPMSMTFAAVPALRQTPELAEQWVPMLTAGRYDPRDVPAAEKSGATMGMSMTEKQGGSDVRANTTRATAVGASGPGEAYTLVGHKWFTSAPMCDAFLTLAYCDQGMSCFLVPRWLPDGSRNAGFIVRRLKDKLGDRSNASSEVEYSNAVGYMVGEPGRGISTILDMVVHTRLDCTLGSASLIHQAVSQAVWHSSHRAAFGARLVEQPAMRGVLADLAVESEAATFTALHIAHSFDNAERDGEGSEAEAYRRMATAVAKYWVCKRAPAAVYEAMECFGGNGYVEEWGMPRLYRQAPLNSIWEGSGNVICLDVLRAMGREPESLAAFMTSLGASYGSDARYDRLLDGLRNTLGSKEFRDPAVAQGQARHLVDRMALALQASLLMKHGDADAAELFIAARIGREGTWNYGATPPTAGEAQADASRAARIVTRFAKDVDVEGPSSA